MIHRNMVIGIVLVLIVFVLGWFALNRPASELSREAGFQDGTNMKNGMVLPESESEISGDAATKASYESYDDSKLSRAADGKVVLFFRASWCPTCRALDADIRKNLASLPGNITILDVDYDKSADLKKKYGVTVQHTLVQVDAQGTEIAKWIGSPTIQDVVAHLE